MNSYNSDVVQDVFPEGQTVQRSVNIDSRDRNKMVYVNTNDYIVNLKDAIFGVKKIELVSAEIPKSEYFIDTTNNVLEILIDPVLFANRSPTGSVERLICHSHSAVGVANTHVSVARIDSSQYNGHGVIQMLDTSNSTIRRGPVSVFNDSPTSGLDLMVLFESDSEVLFVASYSENEENFSGNCRLIVLKLSDLSFSFGSEFQFSRESRSVFAKRLCFLGNNKFALAFNNDDTSVNLLVGSVGIDLSDNDGRLSNSILIKETVNVYSSCSVDEKTSFFVYCQEGSLYCKLVTIDSDFALYLGNEVLIDESHVLHLSCDSINKRVIVSAVDNHGLMKIHLLLCDGPGVIFLNTTSYSLESSRPTLNAGSSVAFKVDPNAQVRWASDVSRVVNLEAQRIDGNIIISDESFTEIFPTIQLEGGRFHRITVTHHPLDPDIPQDVLNRLRIYTSEVQNIEYTQVKNSGTSSMVLYVDETMNTLFYGMDGQSTRGVIRVSTSPLSETVPFTVFTSGPHDVGNKPFTFKASVSSNRSLRKEFASPGPSDVAQTGSMVGVNGSGFLFTPGAELWSFRDEGWSFISNGTHLGPGPRYGTMMANRGKDVYLFGGVSTFESDAPVVETLHFSIVPMEENTYSIRNFRNNGNVITFYDITSSSNRYSFASLVDPSFGQISSGWSGLTDVSSYFAKNTLGFHVNSFSSSTVSYSHDVQTSRGTEWGTGGPNPTGHIYTLEVLIFPLFHSMHTSFVEEKASISILIADDNDEKFTSNFTIDLNTWSNLVVEIDTSSWNSPNLQNLKINITCSQVFMHYGLCAIRDPQLFVNHQTVESGALNIELYFGDVKQYALASGYSFLLEDHSPRVEDTLMNDLWSITLDPFFADLVFCLCNKQGTLSDRCNKIDSVVVSDPIASTFLTTSAVNISDGPPMFSDNPSMKFNGRSVFTLPTTGGAIRRNNIGDFTFACTIQPRLYKLIFDIDFSSTNLVVAGEQPTSVVNLNASNFLPSIYTSGRSIVLDPTAFIDFSLLLPGQFILNAFFFIPSTTQGNIPLIKIGGTQLITNGNDEIVVSSTLHSSFPRDQWFHLSLIANGIAMKLLIDGVVAEGIVLRDSIENVTIGGSGWSGTVLVAGVNACKPFFSNGMQNMTSLSEDHKTGYIPSNHHTIVSCGSNNTDFRLSLDCSGSEPLITASLIGFTTSQVVPDGVFDVAVGRENETIRLVVGATETTNQGGVSMSLLQGDVLLGGRKQFNTITETFCGFMDEVKLLLGRFDGDSIDHVYDGNLRSRSMVWKKCVYSTLDTQVIQPRAHGSLTIDSADPPNLWLFGGDGASGTANDLWQITTENAVAFHITGSPLSSGPIVDQIPGSRSNSASHNDGENIFIFGGETDVSVGPYQFSGIIKRLFVHTSSEEGTFLWEADDGNDTTGLLYPVFTRGSAVLLDSSTFIRAEVSDGTNNFDIFLFPEEDQHTLGLNAFIRNTGPSSEDLSALTVLNYHTHLNHPPRVALSDFWKYEINTATWQILNRGTALRSSTSPGVRSKCNLHFDQTTDMFYLLPGNSSLQNEFVGQDLWKIKKHDWVWIFVRLYSEFSTHAIGIMYDYNVFPGSLPSLYWNSNNRPHLFTQSGHVFKNQLSGEFEETNFHHCIAINGNFIVNEQVPSVEFVNRLTVDDLTVFPGTLQVQSATGIDEGCFLVTTTSRITFVQISQVNSSTQPLFSRSGTREVVKSLPVSTGVTTENVLVQDVEYEFRGVNSSQFSIPAANVIGGATIVADTDFSITQNGVTLHFVVRPLPTPSDDEQPQATRSLAHLYRIKITELINSSSFSQQNTSLVECSPLGCTFRLVYQNASNSRNGEVSTIHFDRSTGYFSNISNFVFSASNPTRNIVSANAMFGRTLIVFSDQTGIASVLTNASSQSPPTTQSNALSASDVRICVLNFFEFDTSQAKWFVSFLFNGNLRLCAQRSLSDKLEAPAQNLVGEIIRFSQSLVLEQISHSAVKLCRLRTGVLMGEIVVLYSDATKLCFKDALVQHCDPLTNIQPPSVATDTFSLVTQPNLISVDFSDFEVLSLPQLGHTNFVAVFLSNDRKKLYSRLFVRESGAYLSNPEIEIYYFQSEAKLIKVDSQTFDLHFLTNNEVIILYTSLNHNAFNELASTFFIKSSLPQTFDNESEVIVADSVVDTEKIMTFSVHESTSTQVCCITRRQIPAATAETDNVILTTRKSFVTRLKHGDYNTASLLIDEMQSKLIDIDENFTVNFDFATTKLSIINKFSKFRILLSNDTFEIEDERASNGLAYILGFRDFLDITSTFDGVQHNVLSRNRIDLFGRQYLYLFLSTPDGPISSETTSRNKENSFGRIILSVQKGETMFFTSSLYKIFAHVSIPVITQLRIRLGRFSHINSNMNEGRELSLYEPQGMEHSFSFKIECLLDKVGSAKGTLKLKNMSDITSLINMRKTALHQGHDDGYDDRSDDNGSDDEDDLFFG